MKIDEKLPWKEDTSGSREEKREDNGGTGVGGKVLKVRYMCACKGPRATLYDKVKARTPLDSVLTCTFNAG